MGSEADLKNDRLPIILGVIFGFLAAASILQVYGARMFALRLAELGSGKVYIAWIFFALHCAKTILLAFASVAFFRFVEPATIWLGLIAGFVAWPLLGLVTTAISFLATLSLQLDFIDVVMAFVGRTGVADLIFVPATCVYLLMSRRVESLYGTGTREWLSRSTVAAWRRLRARHLKSN